MENDDDTADLVINQSTSLIQMDDEIIFLLFSKKSNNIFV